MGMTEIRRPKLTIVGAGSVGATSAYACLTRGVAGTLAIYDIAAQKVLAEVLDLNHGAAFVPRCDVIGSSDIEVTKDSDIVVITAGAKQKPGQTRLDLAGARLGARARQSSARRSAGAARRGSSPRGGRR